MPVVRRFHSVPARSESAGQSPRSGACGPGQPAGDEDDPESARPSRRGRGPVDPCPERAGSALGGQSRRGGGGGGRRWPSRQCVRRRDVGPREVGQPGPLPSATPGFRRRCTGRWPWRSFLEGRGPAGGVAVLVTAPPPRLCIFSALVFLRGYLAVCRGFLPVLPWPWFYLFNPDRVWFVPWNALAS